MKECGECSLCCEIPPVPAIQKPANQQCPFWSKGCKLYPNHPGQCQTFYCLWLMNEKLPDALRPDRCGVMFEVHKQEQIVLALVDPFRSEVPLMPRVKRLIGRMVRDGYVVWTITGSDKRMNLPDGVNEAEARGRVQAAWARNNGSS